MSRVDAGRDSNTPSSTAALMVCVLHIPTMSLDSSSNGERGGSLSSTRVSTVSPMSAGVVHGLVPVAVPSPRHVDDVQSDFRLRRVAVNLNGVLG